MKSLVAGAGGFIGGHLVKRLLKQGHTVRAVDIKSKKDWWQLHEEAQNWSNCDLSLRTEAFDACDNQDHVYNLAADMGGIGFIESKKADCMLSVLINTHLLMGARVWDGKFFYASSACVYHAKRQKSHLTNTVNEFQVITPQNNSLRESDAYHGGGAMPEDGYGWEKLFSERMCRHFHEDYKLDVRIARFHNIYGPYGSWEGGREKAPAASCRKIAEAKRDNKQSIEIWGDGSITRSFCWIGDCIEGILKLMESDYTEPLNIGSSESVTINQLFKKVEDSAKHWTEFNYNLLKPQGVSGRNSDNTLCKEILGWEPSTPLIEGIMRTYPWIEEQVLRSEK